MKEWFEKQTFFSLSTLDRINAWCEQESVFIFGDA